MKFLLTLLALTLDRSLGDKDCSVLWTSKEDNKERYIAPLYNVLIAMGKQIGISSIPESEVNILGTPEELKEFLKNEA